MTRVLIADDEEAPREQLRSALNKAWPAAQLVASAVNGADAWDSFLEFEPEVCFLDIRMPGLSGIDVARRIGGQAQVVFVTVLDDHALAAFDAGAVDYLLKPVDAERLAQTVARLQSRLAVAQALPAPDLHAPDLPASDLPKADLQSLLQQLSKQARRPPNLSVLQAAVLAGAPFDHRQPPPRGCGGACGRRTHAPDAQGQARNPADFSPLSGPVQGSVTKGQPLRRG